MNKKNLSENMVRAHESSIKEINEETKTQYQYLKTTSNSNDGESHFETEAEQNAHESFIEEINEETKTQHQESLNGSDDDEIHFETEAEQDAHESFIREVNEETKNQHQYLESQTGDDEYLTLMGEPQREGYRFVGNGIQSQSEIKLDIGLSSNLKNHIKTGDFIEDNVCLQVGKKREPRNGNTHWVAVMTSEWPKSKINSNVIEGVWIDRRAGRFAFVLSKDFIKEFRKLTIKNNQKLYLKVTFGVKATAGKIWITA